MEDLLKNAIPAMTVGVAAAAISTWMTVKVMAARVADLKDTIGKLTDRLNRHIDTHDKSKD